MSSPAAVSSTTPVPFNTTTTGSVATKIRSCLPDGYRVVESELLRGEWSGSPTRIRLLAPNGRRLEAILRPISRSFDEMRVRKEVELHRWAGEVDCGAKVIGASDRERVILLHYLPGGEASKEWSATVENLIIVLRRLHAATWTPESITQELTAGRAPKIIERYERQAAGLRMKLADAAGPGVKLPDFLTAVDSLKQTLLQRLQGFPNSPVVCHLDPHSRNMVYDSNGNLLLVDWTCAGAGDRFQDLASAVMYFNCADTERQAALVTYLGRQSTKGESERFNIWCALAILKKVTWPLMNVDLGAGLVQRLQTCWDNNQYASFEHFMHLVGLPHEHPYEEPHWLEYCCASVRRFNDLAKRALQPPVISNSNVNDAAVSLGGAAGSAAAAAGQTDPEPNSPSGGGEKRKRILLVDIED